VGNVLILKFVALNNISGKPALPAGMLKVWSVEMPNAPYLNR